MSVPKTAVNEDYSVIAGQHDIRLARQFPHMQAEAEALMVQQAAYLYFRFGIAAADARHHPAARRRINDISH